MLKVRTRFPSLWLIRSNIALDMGFPKVLGLAVILYSVSIRDFLNSGPINYFPWSYVISIGVDYLYSHVVSTKSEIIISLLSSYSTISTHIVTGSIVVTDFKCSFPSCPYDV